MGRYSIHVSALSPAPVGTVWDLLANGASWPVWSPIGSYELEKPGEVERDGLGSIRIFSTRRATGTARLREEIVEFAPERRLRYTVLSGLPVREYVGTVELEVVGDQARIHWASTFSAAPVLGRLVYRTLSRVIAECAEGLAEHAGALR